MESANTDPGMPMDTGFEFWLERIAAGDEDAIRDFWTRFFERLMVAARHRFHELPRRAADEEDIAMSAMKSVLYGIQDGKFPQLDSDRSLWRLLLTVAARKICAERRRHFTERRGGGRQRGESAFGAGVSGTDSSWANGMEGVPDDGLLPDVIVVIHEMTGNLFRRLEREDPSLIRIAQMTLEGYTPKEIAEVVGVVPATIRRKLRLIAEREREISIVENAD